MHLLSVVLALESVGLLLKEQLAQLATTGIHTFDVHSLPLVTTVQWQTGTSTGTRETEEANEP